MRTIWTVWTIWTIWTLWTIRYLCKAQKGVLFSTRQVYSEVQSGKIPKWCWPLAAHGIYYASRVLEDPGTLVRNKFDCETLHSYCGWLRNPAPPKGWLKPHKYWDKPPINWCRISQPSTVLRNYLVGFCATIWWYFATFLAQDYAQLVLETTVFNFPQPFLRNFQLQLAHASVMPCGRVSKSKWSVSKYIRWVSK